VVENLGKLERIDDLKSVWHNEAVNFTPWLQENIGLLSQALGLDIQSVNREVAIGRYSADLVGEEPQSGRPVIIENQLEKTDHSHLGQLLTYAAGKNGGIIIWVASHIVQEHRNALEWLNNATKGNIDFYGVELELLRIGDSPLKAPNFKVVVAPTVVEPPTRSPEELVLVVAARNAWPEYEVLHAYICQENRRFRETAHIAFYYDGAIQRIVPRIKYSLDKVKIEDNLADGVAPEMREFANDLMKRITEHRPGRIGDTSKVLFLTPPGSDETVKLHSEVGNDLETPFTYGHRYVYLKALESNPETTMELLARNQQLGSGQS